MIEEDKIATSAAAGLYAMEHELRGFSVMTITDVDGDATGDFAIVLEQAGRRVVNVLLSHMPTGVGLVINAVGPDGTPDVFTVAEESDVVTLHIKD